MHDYTRTCPILQSNCMPDNADGTAAAPVHMLIGNSGQAMYYNQAPVTPNYYETDAVQHGYLRTTVNGTSAVMEVRARSAMASPCSVPMLSRLARQVHVSLAACHSQAWLSKRPMLVCTFSCPADA